MTACSSHGPLPVQGCPGSTSLPLACLRRLARFAHRAFALRTVDHRPPIDQWEDRAQRFGVRAVLNLGHSEGEILRVTEGQRRELYPLFRASLRGDERLVLDFGCGPGRFTGDLAQIVTGRAIGVDPIRHLLDLAPSHPSVEYRPMSEGQIPLESGSVDAVWICLVLGGIHGETLRATLRELRRVLKPSGLLFLVENTTKGRGNAFWAFRSVAAYQRLLTPVPLEHIHDYDDLGERISVMRGRNPSTEPSRLSSPGQSPRP
jgi:SAM-dependent methyltransferase